MKFFRNIRRDFFKNTSSLKYLKYATGEIVLVVLGILIALQINNWNEWRKERALEIKTLIEIKKSLEANDNEMVQDSLRRAKWNRSSDIIIKALQEGADYNDSFNIHFHNARIPGTNISLSTAGYENLKNIGYHIIASDTVRNGVIELFEIAQNNLLEEMEYFESFQPNRQTQIDQLFDYDDEKFDVHNPLSIPLVPHNYTSLLDDKTYLAMLKSVKVQRNIIGTMLLRNLKETQNVLALINEDLESL